MLKLIALAALVAVGMPGEACADVFGTVNTKGKDLFKNVRTVVFIMGGFGFPARPDTKTDSWTLNFRRRQS